MRGWMVVLYVGARFFGLMAILDKVDGSLGRVVRQDFRYLFCGSMFAANEAVFVELVLGFEIGPHNR